MSTNQKKNRGLGKGLSSLMGMDDGDVLELVKVNQKEIKSDSPFQIMAIDKIRPNDQQPRKFFSQDTLHELADSIRRNGIIQPLLLRMDPAEEHVYQIIAGERRWRASKMVGLKEVPVIIKSSNELETLELSLIENIQRQDLTVIEEAEGYKKLIEDFSYTQEKIAETVGRSRSHIANLLRILSLPVEIKEMINCGDLTMGHARALVGIDNNIEIAENIKKNNLSVREVEKSIKNSTISKAGAIIKDETRGFLDKKNTNGKDADLEIIEKNISQKIGMKVEIEDSPNGGQIIIHFHNLEQLDMVLKRISGDK